MNRIFKPGPVLWTLLVLFLSLPSSANENWALLIGVDHYQSKQITPLNYAVQDVTAVAEVLEKIGVPKNNMFVLTDQGQGWSLATGNNILSRMEWLAGKMQPGDTLYFYFSGHGLEKDGSTYLLSCDTNISSPLTLRRSAVRMSDLREITKTMKASNIITFMDACRNDPEAGKSVSADNALSKGMAKDLTLVSGPAAESAKTLNVTFYSCSPGERSWESEHSSHGFFSYHVMKGLLGEAADANGKVTVNSLEDYLSRNVSAAVDRAIGKKQTPWTHREGTLGGGLVLAKGKSQPHSQSFQAEPDPVVVEIREEVPSIAAAPSSVSAVTTTQPAAPHPARGPKPIILSETVIDYDLSFPLTKGSYWKYRDGPGMETRSIADISERNGTIYANIYLKSEYGGFSYKLAWTNDNWLLRSKLPYGPPVKDGERILKRTVTTGETWRTKNGVYRVESLDKVQTLAGEFQAVRIKCESSSLGESTAWYAQGVGLVKFEADYGACRLAEYKLR